MLPQSNNLSNNKLEDLARLANSRKKNNDSIWCDIFHFFLWKKTDNWEMRGRLEWYTKGGTEDEMVRGIVTWVWEFSGNVYGLELETWRNCLLCLWCFYLFEFSEVFWVLWGLFTCLRLFDVIWCLLMSFDVFWCLLMSFEVFWCLLISFDVFWYLLMSLDVFGFFFDVFWCGGRKGLNY